MAAGTVVYLNGATGNLPTIAKALATSDATSAQTIGLVQTSIADNGTGLVVIRGIVSGLNTQSLTEGQQLYLSSTVAGAYTTTKQYAPDHLVYVGIVTRAHPTLGSIEVAIQNGYEMDEIHDVSAQNPTNGDVLRYNSATGLWEKSTLGTAAVLNAGSSAGNVPVLDANGDLVGPIIGRMMLASDNVVPALGEQCTVVNSLTAPTVIEYRLGDGVTVRGKPSLTGLIKVGTAYIGGDFTGDTRGDYAVDIQSYRNGPTVVASGYYASALGYGNTASGDSSSAIGKGNTASGGLSSAIGNYNTASGNSSSAIGYYNTASNSITNAIGNYNTASGDSSSAIGYYNTASGYYASAIGKGNTASGGLSSAIGYDNTASGTSSVALGFATRTSIDNTLEIGSWNTTSIRSGSIRVHQTGMVAMTVQARSTEYADTAAPAGSEPDNTLARGMFAIRRNGLQFILDYNDAGTVKNIVLGTAA
jgi:hypothetical protein